MNHGSLFTGIGGFDLASRWMGWKNVFQVEKDEFCRKVLAKHFPDTLRFGDIKDFDGTQFTGRVDVLSGGFPCQPFSVAGKRQGKEDDRALWPEMLRVISEIKPRWIVGENVPGIINMELDNVLSSLEDEGYETQTFIIPACALNAPHRRDRVWIVANNASYGCNSRGTLERGRQSEVVVKRSPTTDGEIDAVDAQNTLSLGRRRRDNGDTGGSGRTFEVERPGSALPESDVADSESERGERGKQGKQGKQAQRTERLSGRDDSGIVTNTESQQTFPSKQGGLYSKSCLSNWREHWFEAAARLCVVDDGLSGNMVQPKGWRVNALKAAGNAVVPQIPYTIYQAIQQTEME